MRNQAVLYRAAQGWMMLMSGPWAEGPEGVKALFGTDTLPTAFTESAEADYVLAEIRHLNPGAIVTVR